jgi:hypothetical protein
MNQNGMKVEETAEAVHPADQIQDVAPILAGEAVTQVQTVTCQEAEVQIAEVLPAAPVTPVQEVQPEAENQDAALQAALPTGRHVLKLL